MDSLSITYLVTIATVAVTFVGFSSIVVIFRQTQGSSLGKRHIFLVRFFIEMGLIAAAFSLLPLLLTVWNISLVSGWAFASIFYVLFHVAYIFLLIRRGRLEGSNDFSLKRNLAVLLVSALVDLGLLLNAIGWPFGHVVGPYALAATWGLVVAGLFFVQTLTTFLEQPAK
jgi:hypothetical protein